MPGSNAFTVQRLRDPKCFLLNWRARCHTTISNCSVTLHPDTETSSSNVSSKNLSNKIFEVQTQLFVQKLGILFWFPRYFKYHNQRHKDHSKVKKEHKISFEKFDWKIMILVWYLISRQNLLIRWVQISCIIFADAGLGVLLDISHCDADTCLVNIRASQLPYKEKFDFTYQVL